MFNKDARKQEFVAFRLQRNLLLKLKTKANTLSLDLSNTIRHILECNLKEDYNERRTFNHRCKRKTRNKRR